MENASVSEEWAQTQKTTMDKAIKSSQVKGEHYELPQEVSQTKVLSEPPATGISSAATGEMSVNVSKLPEAVLYCQSAK